MMGSSHKVHGATARTTGSHVRSSRPRRFGEKAFQEQLNQKTHVYPEMVPLIVIRVEGNGRK
jgi:hypothetical protein